MAPRHRTGFEEHWLDEPVPALRGRTPRQTANSDQRDRCWKACSGGSSTTPISSTNRADVASTPVGFETSSACLRIRKPDQQIRPPARETWKTLQLVKRLA